MRCIVLRGPERWTCCWLILPVTRGLACGLDQVHFHLCREIPEVPLLHVRADNLIASGMELVRQIFCVSHPDLPMREFRKCSGQYSLRAMSSFLSRRPQPSSPYCCGPNWPPGWQL